MASFLLTSSVLCVLCASSATAAVRKNDVGKGYNVFWNLLKYLRKKIVILPLERSEGEESLEYRR